jgi:hypothetical protein
VHLRNIAATRYVAPLREGGSLPALVEADDQGVYVLKFRGAGQGPKALIAELIGGELARAAGLRVPEIVLMELDSDMARTEPDPEIQALIRASDGLNIALDFLPGALMYDPVTDKLDPYLASEVVWLDAFLSNVDRTARNTNMLIWHRQLYLIDHGAAIYVHHAWERPVAHSGDAFPYIKDHVLLPVASKLNEVSEKLRALLRPPVIHDVVQLIPDEWLVGDTLRAGAPSRDGYFQYLTRRLTTPLAFVEEAVRARSMLV